MLNQYLKQCCLLIEAKDVGASDFTSIHRITSELDLSKRVVTANATISEEWKKLGYDSILLPFSDRKLLWIEAFKTAFEEGFRKVILLISAPDLLEKKILEEAFLSLRILEVCMGPGKDGNLYLCGFSQFRPEILDLLASDDPAGWKLFQKSAGSVKAAMYKTKLL